MPKYDWSEIAERYGVSDQGDSGWGTAGGDGKFQLGDSGTQYLTEKDYEKNKNSDQTWEDYAAVYGQEAADKKREGNPDGLSASAFDGLMDKLHSGGGPKTDEKPLEVKHSPEIIEAKERVKNWEEGVMSGKTSEEIFPSRQSTTTDVASAPDQASTAAANFARAEVQDRIGQMKRKLQQKIGTS